MYENKWSKIAKNMVNNRQNMAKHHQHTLSNIVKNMVKHRQQSLNNMVELHNQQSSNNMVKHRQAT
jgi:hypothetical protein